MTNTTVLSATDHDTVKRSLIIAGGGMRVAYQAGVIRALDEAQLGFTHADGTSGGTINLAMMLSGLNSQQMCDRWRTLNIHDFVSFVPAPEYLKAHDMMAMGDADGIIDKVFPHLGIDVDKIHQAQGIDGSFNVCNFTQKTNEAISHQDINLDLLVAGISLPIFMPPVTVNDELYTDSVWIKDANLMEAVKRGAEEIWLIWCIGNTGEYQSGAFNQYVHMIELSANGGLFEEFDRIEDINRQILAGQSPYGQSQPIRLHVIKPQFPLPLDPDLYLSRINTATLISMGYTDAKHYLATMTNQGIAFDAKATQMQSVNTPGLTFRETMTGNFALGTSDANVGAEQGKAANTQLAMHAAITIRDMQAFVDDPQHQGQLHGTIDFAPFANGIPAKNGVFNLFSPSDSPDLKYMVYELGFEHEGQSYYLAGKKHVKDDPGFDLWTDTTTLYTQLHKGNDSSGDVIGAGILTLGMSDLVKLVSTMNATNTRSLREKMSVFTRFGRFFMGDLWDSYAHFINNKS